MLSVEILVTIGPGLLLLLLNLEQDKLGSLVKAGQSFQFWPLGSTFADIKVIKYEPIVSKCLLFFLKL